MTGSRVAVVGSGLAGLVAATSAREHGADVVVLERSSEPGGATAQSAGWIWRYRDERAAQDGAPGGDPSIRELVVRSLDADLEWLQELGVGFLSRDTGRPMTTGVRVDPRQVIDVLLEQVEVRTGAEVVDARRAADGRSLQLRITGSDRESFDAVVFAGGGYAADTDRIASESGVDDAVRDAWIVRATAAGRGTSMDAAVRIGGVRAPATGESLVRLVPAAPLLGSDDLVQLVRMGELQVDGTTVVDEEGRVLVRSPHDWSGAMVGWQLARTSGRGTIEFDSTALDRRLHAGGTVRDAVRAAIDSGALHGSTSSGGVWLAVRAGITATRCGLCVDVGARLLGTGGVVPGAFVAGLDAADPGIGGIHSGLALALVLGRRAGAAAALRA